MNYVTLGVIGHVDHGKTSLVKALTGIDTDRLKEEKERGISIALGFAHLRSPDGEIGFIDAPGHEKFVRTMIAGATGSEAVLLVVDVNEGVKQQTVEHLDIARLLGVRLGVVAITKCDTADQDMRELARTELEELLVGTFLSDAPLLYTSAQSGEGLDELKTALNNIVRESDPLKNEGYAYLPVDRAFSMSGFGTVVTGTLRRGCLRVGDEVEIYPHGFRAKVRGLQSHSATVEVVLPGHRAAVNLRGVDKERIGRGDAIAAPGTLQTGAFLDVECSLLDSADAPLKQRQVVRILFGTTETFGRAHFLERDQLAPGETCVLQLQLGGPAAVLNRVPFIIRTYSPMRTIGGGCVLGTSESRAKRFDEAVVHRLEVWARADLEEMVSLALQDPSEDVLDVPRFSRLHRFDETALRAQLKSLGAVELDSGHAAGRERIETSTAHVLQSLQQYHRDEPTQRGITADGLRERLPAGMSPRLYGYILRTLEASGRLACQNGLYRVAGFRAGAGLSERDRALVDEIEGAFREALLEPPGIEAILQNDKDRIRLYRYLIDSGVLVPTFVANKPRTLGNTIVFHKDSVEEAKRRLRTEFAGEGRFETSQAKNFLGISRKYLIPLLECLDSEGFTQRADNARVIVDK